ncbi:MAG TPA: winged helix DNA-binding domain-containing protein [Candidatus Saccharimonadales bacterium]|jgi:hypothetical protein|nr:winged helix DNA-binding domain-containing protein [Candidatus Saccharimonadales bacterium]
MTAREIIQRRMHAQRLLGDKFKSPAEAVRTLVAIQSQDHPGAKWGLGQRIQGATDQSIQKDFDDGKILRTHVLRPTWHYVHPADIRWLLMLTAGRVQAMSASRNRQLGLDSTVFKQSESMMAKLLRRNNYMTRTEIAAELEKAGIDTSNQRMVHLLMNAELESLICSGPMKGKQQSYALLEERVPHAPELSREAALAKLVFGYFSTRGPATVKDFSWWSGLSVTEAKAGLVAVAKKLVNEGELWFAPGEPGPLPPSPHVYLLPNYDELGIGYADRSALFDDSRLRHLPPNRSSSVMNHLVVVDTHGEGMWRRTAATKGVLLKTEMFEPLTPVQRQALRTAAGQYGAFLGLPVTVS